MDGWILREQTTHYTYMPPIMKALSIFCLLGLSPYSFRYDKLIQNSSICEIKRFVFLTGHRGVIMFLCIWCKLIMGSVKLL